MCITLFFWAGSFSPTDHKLATCSDDGTVRIWDFLRCHEERILRGINIHIDNYDIEKYNPKPFAKKKNKKKLILSFKYLSYLLLLFIDDITLEQIKICYLLCRYQSKLSFVKIEIKMKIILDHITRLLNPVRL